MAKLTRTSTPGIYRRHVQGCPNASGKGRCGCKYAVSRRHRGQQRFETYRTFEEARTAKGRQDAGETRPKSKTRFGDYFADWIETYAGRTKRGFEEETRTEYRRSIKDDALPLWATLSMVEIDQAEVRRLYKSMRDNGKSHSAMKKTRGALSPLFNTAIEERLIDFNPVTGVKIPAPPKTIDDDDEDEERGKALKRTELAAFLDAVDPDWRLFFEFLTVTGLRIGEAIGLNWKNAVLTGDGPRIRVREQIYKGRRKKYLKSDEGKRDIPLASAWVDRLTAHRDATYQGDDSPVFASAVGTPLVPGNVYRRVLAPAAIDAGLYVQVGPDVADVELREVVMRSGRRHLAPVDGDATLCGRRAFEPAGENQPGSSCAICEMAAEGLSRKGRKTAIAFHTFRHTCASLLFAEGRNVKQVAKWLGHADPSFTLRVYVDLLDEGMGGGLELFRPLTTPTIGTGSATWLV